jgi:hypothetical protein
MAKAPPDCPITFHATDPIATSRSDYSITLSARCCSREGKIEVEEPPALHFHCQMASAHRSFTGLSL